FTLEFFKSLSTDMPGSVTLFLASRYKRYIAGSFTMKSPDVLYGRHWGCNSWHANLHFEMCYYQTIEYCIRYGLGCLDAGVQGEHKLLRGFMPVRSTSMHWFARPEFIQAIAGYFDQETRQINAQISALAGHNAYNANMDPEAVNK
ncbi:MAG: GNAT family N-acetyltransferase, partial [Thiotrichales bacterium]|nr:GNAT family N-acetyltransferase [Thiotrichales bacterium]